MANCPETWINEIQIRGNSRNLVLFKFLGFHKFATVPSARLTKFPVAKCNKKPSESSRRIKQPGGSTYHTKPWGNISGAGGCECYLYLSTQYAAKTMNAMHRANELKASVGVRECPSGGYVALTYLFVERSNAGRILIAFPNKAFHRPETLRPI